MNDYSIKELRTLATRAARGSYLPWGVAEEAGASVAWLEAKGLSCLSVFIDLLQHFDGQNPGEIAKRYVSGLDPHSPACPILVGCHLSDLAGKNFSEGKLEIPAVQSPILLVPFLVWVAADLGQDLLVEFGKSSIRLNSTEIEILAGKDDCLTADPRGISVSMSRTPISTPAQSRSRVIVSADQRTVLTEFVERTFLPESEQSRASGAGGGSVDDD